MRRMRDIRAFTLIEMLIVIAVIAILAGVVLTGVGGFQASARDTRRIGDLRNTQNLLELYFTQNGQYPSSLTDPGLEGKVPSDPDGSSYNYTASTFEYCLWANLEKGNKSSKDDNDCTLTGGPTCSNDLIFCATSD